MTKTMTKTMTMAKIMTKMIYQATAASPTSSYARAPVLPHLTLNLSFKTDPGSQVLSPDHVPSFIHKMPNVDADSSHPSTDEEYSYLFVEDFGCHD